MHDEERGLLDAIAAHPADDHDRRVYADWLEDHGDGPRAEFVRLQVALAHLPEDHPQRADLTTRERGLLLDHEERWTLGLRQLVDGWTFRRGFVDEVVVRNPPRPLTAERFDELFAWPLVRRITARQGWRLFPGLVEAEGARRLEELCVEGSRLEARQFRSLLDCPHFDRLERLRLRDCGLTTTEAQRLANSGLLGRLRELDLSDNHLHDSGIVALARSPRVARLTHLDLSSCHATGEALLALASAPLLGGLASLKLGGNHYYHGLDALFRCDHLRRLTELDLSKLPPLGLDEWRHLLAIDRPALRALDLSSVHLRKSLVFALLSSPSLASLDRLWLRGATVYPDEPGSGWHAPADVSAVPLNLDLNGIHGTDDFLEDLFLRVPAMRRVRRLAVPGVANSVADFNLLLSSPHLYNLRHLDVSRSYGLSRDSLDRLLRSDLGKRLTGLDLSDCELRDAEISDLANNHPHLANLSWLSLRNNHVGSRGARALAASPHLRNLRHLDLSDNHLDDDGAFHLAAADHLASPVVLDVSGNPIGPAGTAALFSAARRAFARGVTIPHLDA